MSQDEGGLSAALSEVAPEPGIDQVLGVAERTSRKRSLAETHSLLESFCRAILVEKAPRITIVNSISQVFSSDLSFEQRCFACACLLRLLHVDESSLEDGEFRRKAISLFDDVLKNSAYVQLGIEPKDQTHLKIQKLRDVAQTTERAITGAIESLNDLHSLQRFRQAYMRALNAPLSKVVVGPFLPHSLVAQLDDLFRTVEAYVSASGPEALPAYEKARDALEDFTSESSSQSSRYCEQYLTALSERLLRLLTEEFNKGPFAKPAVLELTKTEKKYPLQDTGREIELALIVRNHGPGVGYDVHLTIHEAESVQIAQPDTPLGTLQPGQQIVPIRGTVIRASSSAKLLAEITWLNRDGKPKSSEAILELLRQRSDVDWETLARVNPYDLNPVESEAELVDRVDILGELTALTSNVGLGDAYLWGQKRTGKTSIVKTLAAALSRRPDEYLVIYLEGGDYVTKDAETTVERLGRTLCRRIKQADARLASISIPEFRIGFSPFSDFIDDVREILPTRRIIMILDEFDELPIDLYKPGAVGDALFLSIRSISGKPSVGFVLVGGEKMEFVLGWQGKALNKFVQRRVDYFDRERHWGDFKDLVQQPVSNWLEISEDALVALYEQTAGNPYFTKLVCRELFRLTCDRRDSHITRREIEVSVQNTIVAEGSASFQHFWDDGIVDPMPRREEISIRRRKVLLAVGECLRQGLPPDAKTIGQEARRYGIDQSLVDDLLREFVRRSVLLANGDIYDCKVRLFSRWLQERGIGEIITSFSELDALLEERRKHDDAFVRPEEIVALVQKWGTYRGSQITEEKVRAWLKQFGDNFNQRLMYQVLKGLRFYTQSNMRERMREAHGIVARNLQSKNVQFLTQEGQRKRSHVLVSYLDGAAKSGSACAKLYVDENGIYAGNVVERGMLAETVATRDDIRAVVLLDDFMGSGHQATEFLEGLNAECGEILRERKLLGFFIGVCGFQEAAARLQKAAEAMNLPVDVHLCDTLTEADRCFSEKSRTFPDPADRLRAREIAKEKGLKLEKSASLGYADSQATVVFWEACPNNSLPILWSAKHSWLPLFPRF